MDEQEIILVSIHKPCPGCGEPVTIGASLCPICLENIGRDEGVKRNPRMGVKSCYARDCSWYEKEAQK